MLLSYQRRCDLLHWLNIVGRKTQAHVYMLCLHLFTEVALDSRQSWIAEWVSRWPHAVMEITFESLLCLCSCEWCGLIGSTFVYFFYRSGCRKITTSVIQSPPWTRWQLRLILSLYCDLSSTPFSQAYRSKVHTKAHIQYTAIRSVHNRLWHNYGRRQVIEVDKMADKSNRFWQEKKYVLFISSAFYIRQILALYPSKQCIKLSWISLQSPLHSCS